MISSPQSDQGVDYCETENTGKSVHITCTFQENY